MSPSSAAHCKFISEPMGDKPITAIPGIGPTCAAKFTNAGYEKANALFGKFLLLKKNKEGFIQFLKETGGMPEHHAKSVYECFDEWSQIYLS
ncbi:hypothetical protein AB6A40_002009 [Gnathostoma spinigerum]|uniref:Barrier-to-autointegration factor 1 n=1 Tax=Gnathostoma spinigerum TaxID=75299 RepID=A0ABD6EG65_9BILA